MLRSALRVNGSSVYVFDKPDDGSFYVVVDFSFDNLFFVLNGSLWAVECLDEDFAGGSLLIFDGSELVQVED